MRAIVMPMFGMYMADGTLVQWLKPSGAVVSAGEPVVEIETEKVVTEVVSPESGVLHHIATAGAMLQVESVLGYVLEPGEAPPRIAPTSAEPVQPLSMPQPPAPPQHHQLSASPNARRVAAELGVDLAGVTGSGPGGRITEADVRAANQDRAG